MSSQVKVNFLIKKNGPNVPISSYYPHLSLSIFSHKGNGKDTLQQDESPMNFAHKESHSPLINDGKHNLCEVIFEIKLCPG